MATDITLTGALNYSLLQKENNEIFEGSTILDILQNYSTSTPKLNLSNPVANPVDPEEFSINSTPVTSGLNGDWGTSMWDLDTGTVSEETFKEGLSDLRAENQWGIAQLGAGVGKMITTGLSTFLNNTIGAAYGIAQGLTNSFIDDDENTGFFQGLWDNDFNRAMSDFLDYMETVLPNYYSLAELESPWYTNILSANFWGDKVLKNTGFTLGAIGAAWATGGIGTGIGAITSGAGRLAAIGARGLGAGIGTMKNIMTTSNVAGKLVGTAVNTAIMSNGEASIEAINAVKENEKEAFANLDRLFLESVQALDILDPNFLTKYNQLLEAKLQYAEDIKASLRDVGNLTWGANMAILSASNLFLFKHILEGGYKQSLKLLKPTFTIGDKNINFTEALQGVIKGEQVQAVNAVDKSFGRKLLKTAGNALSEGMEEGSQNLASNTAQLLNLAELNETAARYKYDDGESIFGKRINPEVTEDLVSYTKSFTKALIDNFGGLEKGGWEEFFLGALTGGAGFMSVSRNQVKDENGKVKYGKDGKPQTKWGLTWEGGFAEANRGVNKEYENNLLLVDALNKKFESPEFKLRLLHTVALMDFSTLMDEALAKGDQYTFKNSLIGALAEDFFFFRDAGLIDNFINTYKNFQTIDDKTLELLYLASVNEEGKTELSKEEVEEVRKRYLDNATSNLEKIKLMLDAYELADSTFPKYSEEFKYEVAYEYIKMADAKKRAEDIINKYKDTPIQKSFIKKLNHYLTSSIELQEINNINMSELDKKDLQKLIERAAAAEKTLKLYEAHPEELAAKLYNILLLAELKKEGKDVNSIVENIKKATSLNDIHDAVSIIEEDDVRTSVWDRIFKTADDEVREKLAEYSFTILAQNAMGRDWLDNNSLTEELKNIARRFILNTFRENNHKSDLIIEALEKEAKDFFNESTESILFSQIFKEEIEDSPNADYSKMEDTIKLIEGLLENSIRHLRDSVANYGDWIVKDQIRRTLLETKKLTEQLEDTTVPEVSEEEEAPNIEQALEKAKVKLTDSILESSHSYTDIINVPEADHNKEFAILNKYIEGLLNLAPNLDFYDIDKIIANTIDTLKEKGVEGINYSWASVKKLTCSLGHLILGTEASKEKLKNGNIIYTTLKENFDNYNGSLNASSTESSKDTEESNEPESITSTLTELEQKVYNEIIKTFLTPLTELEKIALIKDIKDTEELLLNNKSIPERLFPIAEIFEANKISTTSSLESDSRPEIITNSEIYAEYNEGFNLEELRKGNLEYAKEDTSKYKSVERMYGSFENWKKVQFIIDNYLREFKDRPIEFIYNADSTETDPYSGVIFTAVKYDPLIAAIINKDGNLNTPFTVITSNGEYLIIGSIGYNGKTDTIRRTFYKKIKEELELKAASQRQKLDSPWILADTKVKIADIGDGRMIDLIDSSEKSPKPLIDLLNNPETNPRKFKLLDLRFSIYYSDGHHYLGGKELPIHANKELDMPDKGKVYVYIPTANGLYYRHPLKVSTYNDIKAESPLMNRLKESLSNIIENKDWSSILSLLGILHTEGSLFFDFKSTGEIVVNYTPREGSKTAQTLSGTTEEMVSLLMELILPLINPRVLISLVALLNEKYLEDLAESGCFNVTSIAHFGTIGANYTLNIEENETKEPLIPHTPKTDKVGNIDFIINGNMYSFEDNALHDSTGKIVSDALILDLLNLIIGCQNKSIPGYSLLLVFSNKRTKDLKGTYYFILSGSSYRIIHKDEHGNWTEITKNKLELITIWKEQLKRTLSEQIQKEAASSVLKPVSKTNAIYEDPSILAGVKGDEEDVSVFGDEEEQLEQQEDKAKEAEEAIIAINQLIESCLQYLGDFSEIATLYQSALNIPPIDINDVVSFIEEKIINPIASNNSELLISWEFLKASTQGEKYFELIYNELYERSLVPVEEIIKPIEENAKPELQKEPVKKDIPPSPPNSTPHNLEKPENLIIFEQIFNNPENTDYSENLIKALTPELKTLIEDFDEKVKSGLIDEELDLDIIKEALKLKGITEEMYLNIRTKELFNNLIEIIKNCR